MRLIDKLEQNYNFIDVRTEAYMLDLPIMKLHSLIQVVSKNDDDLKTIFTLNVNFCDSLNFLLESEYMTNATKLHYNIQKEIGGRYKIHLPHIDLTINTNENEIKRIGVRQFGLHITSLFLQFLPVEYEKYVIYDSLKHWNEYYKTEINEFKNKI